VQDRVSVLVVNNLLCPISPESVEAYHRVLFFLAVTEETCDVFSPASPQLRVQRHARTVVSSRQDQERGPRLKTGA